MLHFADDRALQPDEIARQQVVEDLPAPIFERLVAKRPAREQRKELCAVRPFREDHRAGISRQFAALEGVDELQLIGRERTEVWVHA